MPQPDPCHHRNRDCDLEALEPRLLFSAVLGAAPLAPFDNASAAALAFEGTVFPDPLDFFLPPDALNADRSPTSNTARAGGQTFALSAVPILHSNPDAAQKIYLDFNGHTVINGHWDTVRNFGNPIHAPAFDLDGDTLSFSQTELDWMLEIFQRVSEDYAPFDIDVTTQDPGVAQFTAGNQGVRIIISNNVDEVSLGGTGNTWHPAAGGVAITGSWRWSSDTAAFVFSNFLTQSAKNVAEAASHEAGHTFGLAHDGTDGVGGTTYYTGHGSGETSWAPIMGSSYSAEVTQWSRGEYNNSDNTQDDLALIAAAINEVSYKVDDYGDSLANATMIEQLFGSRSIGASGTIETTQDADYFRFDVGTGLIDLAIDPASLGANLDIKATLYNSAGQVVTQSNPSSRLDAEINVSVSAGTYILKIEGVGVNNPANSGYSDYASLGRYSFVGSIAPVDLPESPAALPGDLNGDFVIGNADLSLLLAQFGQSGVGLTGDINHDQNVDGTDLDYLFAHWGQANAFDAENLSRYIIPTNGSLGQSWTQAGFDDSAWAYAAAALGYDDNDSEFEPIIETELPSQTRSVYVRSSFEVADTSQVQTLGMSLRYDDGFVAYLNGTEIARHNTVTSPTYNSLATATRSDSIAEKFSWFDLSDFRDLLTTGTNTLAIHLMNVSPTSSDLLIEAEVIVTLTPPAAQSSSALPSGEPTSAPSVQAGANPATPSKTKPHIKRSKQTPSQFSKHKQLLDQRLAASLPRPIASVDALPFTPTKRGNATMPRRVMDLLK